MINTDYAQYRDWGMLPKEPEKKPLPSDKWPEVVKKDTIRPHWHSRLKAKAKL